MLDETVGLRQVDHFQVDRYAGEEGTVVQYADTNYDGEVDLVIERVDELKSFSTKGDGKLDHEKLTARGILPPAE